MLAIPPSMFSSFSLEEYSLNGDHYSADSFLHHHHHHIQQRHQQQQQQQQQQIMEPHRSTQSPTNSLSPTNAPSDLAIVKKLNHNANERVRRKKINNLYASLRSMLPHVDQMKKLSNPTTVSRVLKYIPEVQQEIKVLMKKKEELLSNFSKQGSLLYQERKRKTTTWSSLSDVSATQLNDREIVVQISTYKVHENPLSHIVLDLEEDGFSVLNSTTFESFEGRVFYSLHLLVGRSSTLKCDLYDNFPSLYTKREQLFN